MLIDIILLWAAYVLNALLWAGLVVAVLAAVILAVALCKMAQLADGKVAADLEIDR